MTETIYCLKDPVSEITVYIGRTKRTLAERLTNHLYDTLHKEKYEWVQSILSKSLRPTICELEVVPLEESAQREQYWIDKFLSDGHNLLNQEMGGKRTGSGRKPVEEKAAPVTIYIYPSRIESLGGKDEVQRIMKEAVDRAKPRKS